MQARHFELQCSQIGLASPLYKTWGSCFMKSIILSALLGFFISVPTQAAWRRADTDHFIGYSDGSEKELREDMVRLERGDALLRSMLKIPDAAAQVRLTVFFVRTKGDVQKLYGGDVKQNVGGFYSVTPMGAVAVTPQAGDEMARYNTSDATLTHEYAHHLMKQYLNSARPLWYAEGFAEFVSTMTFDKTGIAKLGLPAEHRAHGLYVGADIPIQKLLTAGYENLSRAEGDPFYGRSWLLVHLLTFSKVRIGQLEKYLNLLNASTSSLDAATAAFGPLNLLQKDLEKYLQSNKFAYMTFPKPFEAPKKIDIKQLSEGESAAMLSRIVLSRGENAKDVPATLATLRKIVEKYPNDAAVLTLSSEAEHDAGHWQESITAADAALKLDPSNSNAMMWKGNAMMAQLAAAKENKPEKWKEARRWIVQANRNSTESAGPLLLYYLSYLRQGIVVPDIAVMGLGKAHELIPQEPIITIRYSFALARQKKFDEAIALLNPLANDPHGGAGVTFVRNLISSYEKAKAKGKADGLDALEKKADALDKEGS